MALVELLGDIVHDQDDKEVQVSTLADNELLGIYFSAHWCPPCRMFTPELAKTYKKIKADGKKFQIVFVSSDKSDADMKGYFKEMPWLCLPYSDRARKDQLSKKYGVTGIPTLILVDPKDGSTVTQDGRGKIMNDLEGQKFPYKS